MKKLTEKQRELTTNVIFDGLKYELTNYSGLLGISVFVDERKCIEYLAERVVIYVTSRHNITLKRLSFADTMKILTDLTGLSAYTFYGIRMSPNDPDVSAKLRRYAAFFSDNRSI